MISTITLVLVIVLAMIAFTLSFEALLQLAASSGAVNPNRAWLFPLAVDGSIIVFSMSALRASLLGEDGRWSMSLVVAVTGASILLNIAHAPGTFLAGFLSALPPILLFLSFESLMRQIQSAIRHLPEPPKVEHEVKDSSATTDMRSPVTQEREVAAAPASTLIPEAKERRLQAQEWLSQGLSQGEVSRRLRMSRTTIRRLASELTAGSTRAAA